MRLQDLYGKRVGILRLEDYAPTVNSTGYQQMTSSQTWVVKDWNRVSNDIEGCTISGTGNEQFSLPPGKYWFRGSTCWHTDAANATGGMALKNVTADEYIDGIQGNQTSSHTTNSGGQIFFGVFEITTQSVFQWQFCGNAAIFQCGVNFQETGVAAEEIFCSVTIMKVG